MTVLEDLITQWTTDGVDLGANTLVVMINHFFGPSIIPLYVMPGETIEEKMNSLESYYQIYQTINL